MSTRTKKEAPNYHTEYSTHQFARRVTGLHTGVEFGDDANQAAQKARRAWRQLDPIRTAESSRNGAEQAQFGVALGRAAEIASAVRKVRSWPVSNFRNGLLLDQAGVELASPHIPAATVRINLENVIDLTAEGGRRTNTAIDAKFDELSARAMLLHSDAQELVDRPMESWQRSGKMAIQKASLGSLIKTSVTSLEEMYSMYSTARERSTGSHVSGHLVEGMYFTYRLMQWYKNEGTLASGYPRFALYREDKPMITGVPPRNFDVVAVHAAEAAELVQIKSKSSANYAEGIDVWHPRGDVVSDAPQILEWFDTLVDNEASESALDSAWRNLSMRFEEPVQQVA